MKLKFFSTFFAQKAKKYQVNTTTKGTTIQNEDEGNKKSCLKVRYFVVFMALMGEYFLNCQRAVLGVGIVAMVNQTALMVEDNSKTLSTESSVECVHLMYNLSKTKNGLENFKEIEGEFIWSPKLQGYIHGISSLCFMLATPFAAKLADLYGGKILLFWSMFLGSLFTCLTPPFAYINVYMAIVMQSLRAAVQAGLFISLAVLVANWCPISERGASYSFICCGSCLGVIMGSYVSGILCDSTIFGGWPSAFYLAGGEGIITSLCVLFFLYDNPSVHPKISEAERLYILRDQENALTQKRPKTPWRVLFSSVPVHALGFAYFGQLWTLQHFMTIHPTYLKTILHYTTQQDGLFTALPFILQFLTGQLSGWLSAWLINRKYLSVDKARKLWTLISCLGYSCCVLVIYFAGCNRYLTNISSVLALAFTGFGFAGCWIVSTDMSPTYAASINAIAYTESGLSNFILPMIVGYLTNGSQTLQQWGKAYFISIAFVLSSGVVFAIFGSAEVQSWNHIPETDVKEKRLSNTESHTQKL